MGLRAVCIGMAHVAKWRGGVQRMLISHAFPIFWVYIGFQYMLEFGFTLGSGSKA